MGYLFGESIDASSPKLAALVDDVEIVRQALELALSTPRGSYWSAPEYGCDLRAYVCAGLSPERFAMIQAEVQASLSQDERFAAVSVAATTTTSGASGSLRLDITVTLVGAESTPLKFVAEASAEIVRLYTRGT